MTNDFTTNINSTVLLHNSYLTDSTNSVLSQYFVVEEKLCGAVSYDVYDNRIASYYIQFSNVEKAAIHRIRSEFDRLINR